MKEKEEVEYTWKFNVSSELERARTHLKMIALMKLSHKLNGRDIELLGRSQCLPYFVECAYKESEEETVVPPLSKQEEKLILRRRRRREWLRKLLPFIKEEQRFPGKDSEWKDNG